MGCNIIKAVGLQMAPTTEKIPPEFDRLAGRTVVVTVWADRDIMWDYPKIRLDLAAYVSAYLQQNVRGITVVDPLRVESHVEGISAFDMDPAEVGRNFQADMVVHLSVYQFTIRDPGYAHFLRGRIGSSVEVYDLTRPGEPAERILLREVAVTVPDERAIGYPNIRPDQIRQATYDAFAVEVGRKFHQYEQPIG
jgi:hypothetical protein